MLSMKVILKKFAGNIASIDFFEKITEYAIHAQAPSVSLDRSTLLSMPGKTWVEVVERGRCELWKRTLDQINSSDIMLLEFGVWKGDSMREFTRLNTSSQSLFYGFDSFEGLPEVWRGTGVERFDVGGQVPNIDDPRVTFVKGWFRDTLPPLLDKIEREAEGKVVLIHFDADLYSSTLYLLFTLSQKLSSYYFIFDEFAGHEMRAVYNFIQATGARCDFFYHVNWKGYPAVVSGRLSLPDAPFVRN